MEIPINAVIGIGLFCSFARQAKECEKFLVLEIQVRKLLTTIHCPSNQLDAANDAFMPGHRSYPITNVVNFSTNFALGKLLHVDYTTILIDIIAVLVHNDVMDLRKMRIVDVQLRHHFQIGIVSSIVPAEYLDDLIGTLIIKDPTVETIIDLLATTHMIHGVFTRRIIWMDMLDFDFERHIGRCMPAIP